MDEITVGARYYTNGPGPQQVRGFLSGDIAELLVYSRVLRDDETERVRQYLDAKHALLKEALPATLKLAGAAGQLLERVADPPPVQMLVPGFTVKELPVELTNLNNVKYRADGKLVALAYNGNIYLLSDTDGDRLEDRAELFWEAQGRLRGPIGLALTPPGYEHGNGVFVPSKGKLSLIVDTDGDDRADKEIIVAEGWKEIPQAVDAVGVALDSDGNIYFALGTADYSNAYLIDQQGRGHYDLAGERGTVQKVSPDFSRRETVCTGVRFPVAMAFNRHGDLFSSEQEGATWLPNGNPFDELLHIQPGRHYGFPPRHPRHLPGVIDEPSVFDFSPQHQSTCGLNFNEPVLLDPEKGGGNLLPERPEGCFAQKVPDPFFAAGGPTFGPADWAGDAIICGESRGKLYRTKLVKTPSGYVAQTVIIACLNMLTVDACVSPHGDLVVATHSGPPDWGTGPNGPGKLYKISYSDPERPQPTAVWAAGPHEVHVAFDGPLAPQHLKALTSHTKITYGKYARAGDRFESLVPPYAVVQMQLATLRFDLPVYGAQVTTDRRTLILTTAPQRDAVHYAVMLPGMGRPPLAELSSETTRPRAHELPQHPQIDLDYSLTGVSAEWRPKEGVTWSGWLPHLDPAVSRAFTMGSAAHEQLWQSLEQPGTLTLRTQVDLTDMLRPAVQPGSRIDYEWPAERVTLTFSASCPLTVVASGGRRPSGNSRASETVGSESGDAKPAEVKRHHAEITIDPKRNEPVAMELILSPAGGVPALEVSFHTAEDSRPRALPPRRFLLPWVEPTRRASGLAPEVAETALERRIPELEGGSWSRGRAVFFSEDAACSKCHKLHGEGGAIGPDLTNLVHRDYRSVLRDVTEPSFGINPDYITYLVALKDGRVLTGSLRSEAENLLIGDEKGHVTVVHRDDIEQLQPASKSVMPEQLPKALGPDRMRDLMTFLLTEPPHMPRDFPGTSPPARPRAEVVAALAGAPDPPEPTRPIRVVLVAGPKDHGPGEHDYPAWQRAWAELLAAGRDISVATAWEWPKPDDFQSADVLVFYQHGTWTPERARDIDAYLARGGGLVFIHFAVDGSPDAAGFAQRIGLAAPGGQTRYRHGPLDLVFHPPSPHAITRNFAKVHFHDESYWRLVGDPKRIHLLATSVEDDQPQPQLWTVESGRGRVFVSILGHYSWTFDDPLFRILLLRGIAWSAREPVDRFNELGTIGARLAD
jgi:putative heme-binding domain-containing protein